VGHFQDVVEHLKRELTLDSLLPRAAQGKRTLCCPLPGHADKTPSFTHYRETNSWICWSHPGGRSAGSVLDYLMAERGVSFKEAVQIGADLLGIELKPPTEEEKVESAARRQREDVLTVLAQVCHGWLLGDSDLATRARSYLHDRGFTDELIRAQRVGLLDIQKLFQVRESHPWLAGFSEADFAAVGLRGEKGNVLFLGPRLAIPLLVRQRVTSFTFRALEPQDKRKYLHLPGPAGLYNEDALHHPGREVVLTEGIPDCWTLLEWDIPSLGCLGAEASKHAVRFARQRRVTLVWDNDATGRGRVLKSARALQAQMPDGDVCILHVPGEKDINDWARAGGTKEEFQALLKAAPDLIDYQIDLLPDVKGGGRLGREEQELLLAIIDALLALDDNLQSAYLKRISRRIDTPVKGLREMLKDRGAKRKEELLKSPPEDGGTQVSPRLLFKDTVPYVAALNFSITDKAVGNLGVWVTEVDEDGEIPVKFVVESRVDLGTPQVSIVRYASRAINDKKLTRFPDPDLPRWNLSKSIPNSVECFMHDPSANTPSTAELFLDIRALLKEFIWYPAEHEFDIIALWIMMTYVYPLFGTLGYLHFNGITGSGKSLSLNFIHQLAFNARKTTNITDSALFRLVHANRATAILDEAEKLSYPKPGTMEAAIRTTFLDSYKEGSSASRTNMDTGLVEIFDTYGPKCFGSINEIDHVFGNRCIVIRSLKKQKDVVLKDHAQNDREIKTRTALLRNRLHCWALTKFHLLHKIYTEDLMGALPDLYSREREIWLPLITLAHQVDRESGQDETCCLVDTLLKAQREKSTEQEERARRENLDILILQTLLQLITGEDRRVYELLSFPHEYSSAKLAEALHTELLEDGLWPFEKKLSANRLTNTLKTHHVISEEDVRRRVEGGKRSRSIRLLEAPLHDALRRLHGQEDDDMKPGPASLSEVAPNDAGISQAGQPGPGTTPDMDPLPF